MNSDFVFGVLDNTHRISDPRVAGKYRDITISWARYAFHGPMVESDTVDRVLEEAAKLGRYCFIQPSGYIVWEAWTPFDSPNCDLPSLLRDWAGGHDFLVAGSLVGDAESWYGFNEGCLLVDLEHYQRLGAPRFEGVVECPIELPGAATTMAGDQIAALVPNGETESCSPQGRGWHLIAASLRDGLPVRRLSDEVLDCIRTLSPESSAHTRAMADYLDDGIASFPDRATASELSPAQTEFLQVAYEQTANARRGVGLWNIESYADVHVPLEDFDGPVASLYSVAQGFKSNMILEKRGFDENTRVVFFDYSPDALAVKQRMIELWDGTDFPSFVSYIFEEFPYPRTYYHLWSGVTPETIDARSLEFMWQRELESWGGSVAFQEHWRRFRELEHRFVCCDLLNEPEGILDFVVEEDNAVIWWSNAFFTVYSNWYYLIDQRRELYENWIALLAEKNAAIHLYGSDYNNSSVNAVRAADYWNRYRELAPSCLSPCNVNDLQIRV